MIQLDFIAEDDVLEEDLSGRTADSIDEAAWLVTRFEFPVRFCVNGVELLQRTSPQPTSPISGADWVTVPPVEDYRYGRIALVGFAVGLYRAALSAHFGDLAEWMHVGPLRLRATKPTIVLIELQHSDRAATGAEAELFAAATRCRADVKRFLMSRVPEMQKHLRWNSWFPEDFEANGVRS